MAQKSLNQEVLLCPVCLEVLKEPVTIPCGHSYCRRCVKQHWDQEEQKQIFSCPECRQCFSPRPVPIRHIMLAALVEQLNRTELTAAESCSDGRLPHHDTAVLHQHQQVASSHTLQEERTQTELSTRDDFLQYSTDITLDPDTAHTRLSVSEGNRRVTVMSTDQRHLDHPDRFDNWHQVLSRESLTGRCYWEVEWSGSWVRVVVSHRDISRKGWRGKKGFGNNDKSWALRCDENSSWFVFKALDSWVSGPAGSRIGVFLDHSAGVLSFYSVSGRSMRLLHREETTFSQPLCAGVWLSYDTGATALFPQLT